MKRYVDIPPVWALAFTLAALFADRAVGWPYLPIHAWVALIPVVAGLLLVLWAALWFWRQHTSIEPRHTPSSLIKAGPFRLNRNPIYTGLSLGVLGFALWLGSLSALLVVCFYPWVMTRRFILAEERTLRATFGDDAETFFQHTRRW